MIRSLRATIFKKDFLRSIAFLMMALLIIGNTGITVAQSADVGPDDALTIEDLRSVQQQYAWFNLHAGGCSGVNGGVTASGPAADLLTKAGLDPQWVNLIVADAAVAKTDPLAMASLLFWEHRGFPPYKSSGWGGSPSNGEGPWQITAGTWPSSAGPYNPTVNDPVASTKVAAAIVKSYGGQIGIAGGSIQQDFAKNVHLKTVATLAKNYNAGQGTWRTPGVSDWNAGGRDWQYGGGTSWGGTKNRIIDDYVVAMTYVYYQIATGKSKPPKSADTNSYVAEGRSHINDIKNFKWDPTGTAGSGTTDPGGAAGTDSPVIVLDPGHAKGANMTHDPATGIGVGDYYNPGKEMQNAWDIANEVEKQLTPLGYKVVLTKGNVDGTNSKGKPNTNLKQRADVGTQNKAALGISIHTSNGKGTSEDENFVPLAGKDYVTGNKRYTYTNSTLADTDLKFAKIFQETRAAALNVDKNVVRVGGYHDLTGNMGSISKGTMLTTQYFATIPWMYFEQTQDGPNGSLTTKSYNAYVKGIVDGVKKAIPSSGTASGDNCNGDSADTGTGTGNALVDMAIRLSWPNQKHTGKYCSDAKPGNVGVGYEATMRKYNNRHGYDECSDCGVFVATVVRASGVDPDYVGRVTADQEAYMANHPNKWKRIKTTITGDLHPGDILINPGHTYIYTGVPGDKYNARSASLGGHTPWASSVYWTHKAGTFHVYRKI